MSEDRPDDLALIYDAQCPVCQAYSARSEIDAGAAGDLRRIDARGSDSLVQKITAAGLDLDEGMVVRYRGEFYHGADALHLLATLAPRKGLWNRVNRFFFGSLAMSRLSYPVLRAGRNLLLRILGRKKIRNLDRK